MNKLPVEEDEEEEDDEFFEVVKGDTVRPEEEISPCFDLECLVSPRCDLHIFPQPLHLKPA